MKTVRVEVTADHIARGRQSHAEACPIALAFESAGVPGVAVVPHSLVPLGRGEWWADCPRLAWIRRLPDVAAAFAHTFDIYGAGAVSPFAFDVEVPR